MTGGSTAGRAVSVAGVGAYLPEKVVGLDFFFDGPLPDDPMLHSPLVGPPPLRHHVAPDQRASEMIHRAATPLLGRLGIAATDIDILLTNVLVPDELFTGCGAETAALLGCAPEWTIDLHNTGCASFAYMMRLARCADLHRPGADGAAGQRAERRRSGLQPVGGPPPAACPYAGRRLRGGGAHRRRPVTTARDRRAEHPVGGGRPARRCRGP
ncbi:hypothetical protein [Micromonospora inyonensis]|uniref:hypothetical protein n=1 Tax=Micromonospora inyonensis TaxID=47866 RepID=UPI000AE0D960|nr:hypothetical protein [Micromonospora inyonensis]